MGHDDTRPALIYAVNDQIIDIMYNLRTPELMKLYRHFITCNTNGMRVTFEHNSVNFRLKKKFKLVNCTHYGDCTENKDCVECMTKLMIRFSENAYWWNSES